MRYLRFVPCGVFIIGFGLVQAAASVQEHNQHLANQIGGTGMAMMLASVLISLPLLIDLLRE